MGNWGNLGDLEGDVTGCPYHAARCSKKSKGGSIFAEAFPGYLHSLLLCSALLSSAQETALRNSGAVELAHYVRFRRPPTPTPAPTAPTTDSGVSPVPPCAHAHGLAEDSHSVFASSIGQLHPGNGAGV